jgi:transposase
MIDEEIAETLGISLATVYRIRKGYHQEGLARIFKEKPRSGAPSKVDGRLEAQLTTLACSDPPEGYAHWTHRLLADKLVSLELSVRAHRSPSAGPMW